ncbi:hypothetical protein SUGI_0839370 [Cryptomeria japonica]|nr:hypothetical protein SUGI_0839370 [Cryptomeria japonica]
MAEQLPQGWEVETVCISESTNGMRSTQIAGNERSMGVVLESEKTMFDLMAEDSTCRAPIKFQILNSDFSYCSGLKIQYPQARIPKLGLQNPDLQI